MLAVATASAALALGTPAGTVIENTATMEFLQDDGTPVLVPTTPVTTTVAAVCRPSVLPNGTVDAPGQTASLLPGESTVFKYTLANTGNASNTFTLTTVNEAASQFSPGDVAVYQDLNGNGLIDGNETAITQITLAADATANLLVRAATGTGSRGNAYLNLVAACATNIFGTPDERDDNNVSQISLAAAPDFTLQKTFTPDTVRPGDQTTVNITATNAGGASRPVTVSDFLNTPEMRDFVFVSGSARVTGNTSPAPVIEYSADGTTWTATEPGNVAAVRVRAESMVSQGTLGLTFSLKATDAAQGKHRNVAQLVSGGQTVEAPADITVRYLPSIALGPIGNPEAKPGGELSADDQQTKTTALLNREICFDHTVKNLGDREDTITTTGNVDINTSNIVFRDMAGKEIPSPFQVTLAPGATSDFKACYTPTQAAATNALKVTLTSTSSRGAEPNKTVDLVNTVEEQKMVLNKTNSKGNGFVAPGDEMTYTLTFTNSQNFAMTNVVVIDDLNIIERTCVGSSSLPGSVSTQSVMPQTSTRPVGIQQTTVRAQADVVTPLDFVSADNGGVLEGTKVIWRFPTVAAGETKVLHVTVRVPTNTPDCVSIKNLFTVESSELPTPIPSNTVVNQVFNPTNFNFIKTSTPPVAVVGEEITYVFTARNLSTTLAMTEVKVDDNLPEGIQYVEGSSLLDGAPITPTIDPANPRHYTWTIPGLSPGATSQVTFRALVLSNAPAQLKNFATGTVVLGDRQSQSPVTSAINKIQPLPTGGNIADIVGYVFQDNNRNGIYDYGIDIPCPNARVILSNGRLELTDTQGRYHFRNVREGEWALRLDPNSVAAQNLSMPMDAGKPGSRLTYVRNLTSIDFPLAPDAGDIAVIRDTTLRMKGGPSVGAQNSLTVRKQVFGTTKEPGLYTVQLTLSASAPLNAFTLTDPLPTGATLVDGQNTLTIDPLPGGERLVTYRFRFGGDAKAAVTDPTASWRY